MLSVIAVSDQRYFSLLGWNSGSTLDIAVEYFLEQHEESLILLKELEVVNLCPALFILNGEVIKSVEQNR